MKQANAMETLMGAVVIGVAGLFLIFAYTQSDTKLENGYTLRAQFQRIDGLRSGSDVRVGGVKVGSIKGLSIDAATFLPVATFTVQRHFSFPKDTQASIISSGLMGDKYLDLSPGGSEENLKPDDVIYDTQDSVNLETLIGKAIFQSSKDK